MGLNATLQNDIARETKNSLLDTVKILTITQETILSYDAALGKQVSSSVDFTMDCIWLGVESSEKTDESDTDKMSKVIVLDQDKTVDFAIGQRALVNNNNYEIADFKTDPAGATHTLKLRKM